MARAPTRTWRKLISCFFDLQLISELFICEILQTSLRACG